MGEDEEYQKELKAYHKELDDGVKTYKQETDKCILENQKAQDQMILVISAALFGLMPFLLDKLQIIPCFGLLAFLLLLSNLVALISTLLSFHFCKKGAKEDFRLYKQQIHCIKELSKNASNGSTEAAKICCNNKTERSRDTLRGERCNMVSMVSMIITTILVFVVLTFYLSNKEINMASQNNNNLQQSSSVGVGNEGIGNSEPPSIPVPPQPPAKNDSESSKTSKEEKSDKKQ